MKDTEPNGKRTLGGGFSTADTSLMASWYGIDGEALAGKVSPTIGRLYDDFCSRAWEEMESAAQDIAKRSGVLARGGEEIPAFDFNEASYGHFPEKAPHTRALHEDACRWYRRTRDRFDTFFRWPTAPLRFSQLAAEPWRLWKEIPHSPLGEGPSMVIAEELARRLRIPFDDVLTASVSDIHYPLIPDFPDSDLLALEGLEVKVIYPGQPVRMGSSVRLHGLYAAAAGDPRDDWPLVSFRNGGHAETYRLTALLGLDFEGYDLQDVAEHLGIYDYPMIERFLLACCRDNYGMCPDDPEPSEAFETVDLRAYAREHPGDPFIKGWVEIAKAWDELDAGDGAMGAEQNPPLSTQCEDAGRAQGEACAPGGPRGPLDEDRDR